MSNNLTKIDINKTDFNNIPLSNISIEDAISFAKQQIFDSKIEKLIVIFTKNDKALCYAIAGKGDENTTGPINLGEIAKVALILEADGVIEIHNHPNDVLKFSFNDFNFMKESFRAFNCLDIKLKDCMIVVPSGEILSMARIGLIATYETYFTKYSGFEAVYMKYMQDWQYEEEIYSLKKNVERINRIIDKYGNKDGFNHYYGIE